MKTIFAFALIMLLACVCYAQKIEKISDTVYRLSGDSYVAETGTKNGAYLRSFKVGGMEFEEQKIAMTGGNFFQKAESKIGEILSIDQKDNTLTLNTDAGKMIFECYADRLEIRTEENPLDYAVGAVFVISNKANLIKTGEEYQREVITASVNTAHTFIYKRTGIEISGEGVSFWGPWMNSWQVADISIAPGQAKKMVIKPVSLTEKDLEISLDSPLKNDIYIYSPKKYQVFQRYSKDKGTVIFSAKAAKDITEISYRITGKDYKNRPLPDKWIPVKLNKFKDIDLKIDTPSGGWYNLEIKYTKNGEEITETVENIGVGEIIIGAGQSNSTNCGQTPVKSETGFAVNTDGINWRIAHDPQIGVHDDVHGGSLYPALGDALYREFNVPIALAPTGRGATTLEQWQPDAAPLPGTQLKPNTVNLYDFFMERVRQFGNKGFRCVLWHQGEGDFFATSD
ncbi:MAG: hypothetical protein KBT47_03010, partial [Armatimonadetes bacterium]|nr:hypothetical protein [Candidatus Hippobium faecium]